METALPGFKPVTKRYWLWPLCTLLLQSVFVAVLYSIVHISDEGRYEFPLLANRNNIIVLLVSLSVVSLLLGIISTYMILRHQHSWHKWLWVAFACLPSLFMGCLYLHFLFIIKAWV
jgi:hypothetical protein